MYKNGNIKLNINGCCNAPASGIDVWYTFFIYFISPFFIIRTNLEVLSILI